MKPEPYARKNIVREHKDIDFLQQAIECETQGVVKSTRILVFFQI
jgi:hypothetical protein